MTGARAHSQQLPGACGSNSVPDPPAGPHLHHGLVSGLDAGHLPLRPCHWHAKCGDPHADLGQGGPQALDGMVSADAAKSGSARVVPLNSEALDVLNARPKGVNVFTRPTGAPVKQVDAREFLPGPSPQPVSRISASMTCGTPGRAGMSDPARPCSY